MDSAKQQWLVFSATQHSFAVDTSEIVEIVPVVQKEPEKADLPGVLGWIEVQDEKVPVIDLVGRFHHKQSYPQNEIIVVKGAEQLIGLMAERVIAVTTCGDEAKLHHCIHEPNLISDVMYLSPNSIAIARHS